ncbi:hypothetical protein EV702DRAFT_978720, partial [Suillus placidus]
IRVLTVPFANKWLQMAHGIKNTTTDIIVFSDDDAIWPPILLPYVLACFEDQKVGGIGTSQHIQPVGESMTVWEVLVGMGNTRKQSVTLCKHDATDINGKYQACIKSMTSIHQLQLHA